MLLQINEHIDFFSQFHPLLKHQQELMAIQARMLRVQVEEILEQRSKDIDRIYHIMDDLLVVIPHGHCMEDFERLNNYLKTLDAEAAPLLQ